MLFYDGRDIRVIARLFDGCEDLIVTFTGRTANPPVEKGFGEPYLIKRGISAIHFISKANHWWQTPEPAEAIARLKEAGLLAGRRRTVLYGSSMGGYAAIILSRVLAPSQVVVFSPQYSIDAARAPFEQRWRNYAAKLTFDHDDMAAGIDMSIPIKVVFDPFFHPDAGHVDLIEQHRPVERIAVSFAGHNTARMLQELGILTEITDALLLGDFDTARFTRVCRRVRQHASLFWYGLAETLGAHHKRAEAAAVAMIAATIAWRSDKMRDRTLRVDMYHLALRGAYRLGDGEMVAQWLAQIDALDSNGHRAAFARALAADIAGDQAEALRCAATAAQRLGTGSAEAEGDYAAMQLDMTLATGGAAAARALHARLKPRAQRAMPVRLIEAKIAIAEGKFDEAIQQLQAFCRIDHYHALARIMMADAWVAVGKMKAPAIQLNPLLAYPVGNPALVERVALLLRRAGDHEAAAAFQQRELRFRQLYRAARTRMIKADWSNLPMAIDSLRNDLRKRLAAPDAAK